jgi:hypothetical protein
LALTKQLRCALLILASQVEDEVRSRSGQRWQQPGCSGNNGACTQPRSTVQPTPRGMRRAPFCVDRAPMAQVPAIQAGRHGSGTWASIAMRDFANLYYVQKICEQSPGRAYG